MKRLLLTLALGASLAVSATPAKADFFDSIFRDPPPRPTGPHRGTVEYARNNYARRTYLHYFGLAWSDDGSAVSWVAWQNNGPGARQNAWDRCFGQCDWWAYFSNQDFNYVALASNRTSITRSGGGDTVYEATQNAYKNCEGAGYIGIDCTIVAVYRNIPYVSGMNTNDIYYEPLLLPDQHFDYYFNERRYH